MKLNPNRLRKDEILELFNIRCRHGHNYWEHPKCFTKDQIKPLQERIGFLDIESSNLNATFGFVFSYCIKRLDGEVIKRVVSPQDIKKGRFDKNLMLQFLKDVREFDTLVVYYGERFDMPFLRSRCMYHKLDFPLYKEVKLYDVWFTIRKKMKLHSNRLETVCDFLGIEAKNHPMKQLIWLNACAGDKKSLDYIVTHNVEDVVCLEELYKRVLNFSAPSNKSI